jgi:purine-binding chemotaxis protein CheW
MPALPETPPPNSGSLVLFVVGGMACALPRESVRALLPLPRLDSPPGLPRPLAGFLNLGGVAVPVVELALLLGGESAAEGPYRHLILLERAEGLTALLVDRVVDVVAGQGLSPRPVTDRTSLGGCVAAEVESAGLTVHVLAPDRLLLAQEAAILEALSKEAQRRLSAWGAAAPDGIGAADEGGVSPEPDRRGQGGAEQGTAEPA